MTRAESFGLVTTIIASAPIPSIILRSATDAVAPTTDLICVVSDESRDTISPDCERSKNSGESAVTCEKTALRRSATTRSPSEITKK
ncbi:hypothetical protein DK64_2558 [Brucella neotomae 5K33]|nr:hypothetical protein C032_01579 [Brucella abortus 63/294]ENS12961.1 hypothetical protein C980_00573 [Brucella abortus 88/217]ERU08525.1 hypothetical protein P039_01058 [Brucella abortus 07-0994-2411]KFJ55348.1 hypothetical protein DK64_2558 [Brucella neotomae 5K33]